MYAYETFIIENICNIEKCLIICMFWILLVQIFFLVLMGFFLNKGVHCNRTRFCWISQVFTASIFMVQIMIHTMELDKGFCFISHAMFIFFSLKYLSFFPYSQPNDKISYIYPHKFNWLKSRITTCSGPKMYNPEK